MTSRPLDNKEAIAKRSRLILVKLEQALLSFIRTNKITHEEYRCATDTLIASVKAGEGSLLCDVFLEAQATDVGNVGRQGSFEAIEGPFYLPDAPRLTAPHVLPQRSDEAGEVLFFCGRVTSTDGAPLADAELDLWQADAAGHYSNFHPGAPDWNLRGRFQSGPDGKFEVRTIVPPPYEIPSGGPTGILLSVLGRHAFRPAHLHLKVRHPQCSDLTSQIFFDGGDYLDSDVANAVREGLVARLVRRDAPDDLAARGLDRPYFEIRHDLVLAPREIESIGGHA